MSTINYNFSLFIFRRDLRIPDNTALIAALKRSTFVIPIFILTPAQVSDENKFKSSNAIQFMMESLKDLNTKLEHRLFVLYGDELNVIEKIHRGMGYNAIFFNEDYSPYAIQRDMKIKSWCKTNKIDCNTFHDVLLTDTLDIKTGKGTYYKVFGQFYKKFIKEHRNPRVPVKTKKDNFIERNSVPSWMRESTFEKQNKFLLSNGFYELNDKILEKGGRDEGLKILRGLSKFKSYEKTRNNPAVSTTHLSPHNKFGTVSIREVWYAIKEKTGSKTLLQQLVWRDFYYYIGFHYPELFKHEHLMKPTSKLVSWESSKGLKAWQTGTTGFPIVDAGMRELNETGFIHNRVRMIVAMFLTKDLLINWKYGERYFSQKLIDIDRAQNVGNWNWSSSFGLDHSTFLRIFNPWTQSENFDYDCEYIKKWIPELRELEPKIIHRWNKYHADHPEINYPKPIVDHDVQRKKYIKFYNRYFK